ncbi:MAG: serpin family protein [Atribacterota bacterium]
MERKRVFLCLAVLFISFTGCVSLAQPRPLYTDFALSLFTQLYEGNEDNILLSPWSVALALSMTVNGARGTTQISILKALGYPDPSVTALNEENQRLVKVLQELSREDPGVKIKMAHTIFVREGISLREQFLHTVLGFYEAYPESLDFGNPLAVETINRWVREKTEGKIDGVLERLDPDSILILLNAVFFQGAWSIPFDIEDTQLVPFHFPGGVTREHPIMFQSGWYRYLATDDFQAVGLPYGEKGRLKMYLFLPHPEMPLSSLLAQLTPENWQNWMRGFERRKGRIGIPRFTLSYGTVDLKRALSKMGMEVAFSPQADFGNLTDEPAFIKNVFHRSLLEVSEKGTEASAATAVVVAKGLSQESEEAFEMVIDRPFFLAVVEEDSGLILFMGMVFSPEG